MPHRLGLFFAAYSKQRAFGTGMYCDVEHASGNAWLADALKKHRTAQPGSRVEAVELARDGLEMAMWL